MIATKTIAIELNTLSPDLNDPILAAFTRLLVKSLASTGEQVCLYSDKTSTEARNITEKLGLERYVNEYIQIHEVNSNYIVIDQLAITIFYGKTLCQFKELINDARSVLMN